MPESYYQHNEDGAKGCSPNNEGQWLDYIVIRLGKFSLWYNKMEGDLACINRIINCKVKAEVKK